MYVMKSVKMGWLNDAFGADLDPVAAARLRVIPHNFVIWPFMYPCPPLVWDATIIAQLPYDHVRVDQSNSINLLDDTVAAHRVTFP